MYPCLRVLSLLSDIIRNHSRSIWCSTIIFFLTPRLIYDFTPIGVLAAVLVVFGVLTKHNEITAFKACGISAHRLAAPVLIACLVPQRRPVCFRSLLGSGRRPAPGCDLQRHQRKAAQTYLHPERKWINTAHDRIYYYEYFDPVAPVMSSVNVYEIDPETFRWKRHIFANRARWEPSSKNGNFKMAGPPTSGNTHHGFDNFPDGTRTFTELEEAPDYFMREAGQSRQMNFEELENYIADLQREVSIPVSLQVQLQ